MHSLHADDSPALPTRRSRRVSQPTSPTLETQPATRRERNYSSEPVELRAAPVPVPAPVPAPSVAAPTAPTGATRRSTAAIPTQPLTRAQMREARLASSHLAEENPSHHELPSSQQTAAPLTRAQLRALAQATEEVAPQNAPDNTPDDEAPKATAPKATAPKTTVPKATDGPGTQNVIDEVRAVVEEVERRMSAASHGPSTHETLVLSQGTEELVDTNAPGCETHGTSSIEAVDVFPGTSIAVNPQEVAGPRIESGQPTFSFEEALNPKSSEHEHSPVAHRTQHGNARIGALSRISLPARDEANARTRNQWASRIAVLSTIGLATIGVPLLASGSETGSIQASDGSIDLEASAGPTTIEFLNEAQQRSDIPNSIALSITEDERAVLVASRSDERGTLDNCDGSVNVTSGNGLLASSELCTVMGVQIQPEAAIAFTELNKAFTARFGHEMCITSGYRSLSQQYSVKAQKGSLAATPGRSNHGFGNAVDLCPTSYQSIEKWNWLHENAPTFGWDLPGWASRSYEPWHWEYTSGVEATNAY